MRATEKLAALRSALATALPAADKKVIASINATTPQRATARGELYFTVGGENYRLTPRTLARALSCGQREVGRVTKRFIVRRGGKNGAVYTLRPGIPGAQAPVVTITPQFEPAEEKAPDLTEALDYLDRAMKGM